ncbi:MAG TPA: Uma2 family endonuclease [Thermoanaerobaculia bacterium]
MAKLISKSASYDDLSRMPDDVVAELVHGDLFASPRPAFRHARAQGRLFRHLARAFEDGENGPGGWWIVAEPEIRLYGSAVVPDLAGWRLARVPDYPDVNNFDIPPDWLCEVVSPSTERHDRVRKLPFYAGHGVQHAWIVDPQLKMLEVLRLSEGHWLTVATHAGDDVVRAEPFEAIELNLGWLWLE